MLRLLAVGLYLLAANAVAADFMLTSPDIKPNARIDNRFVFKGFGCEGENMSPALEWRNAPPGTKSFAVTMYDPDAPTGSGWWHWVVFNIPANVTKVERGAGGPDVAKAPKGAVQSRTDFGGSGYGGPCPPKGLSLRKPHRYVFTVHALKVDKLADVDENASGAMVGFMLNANSLGKATLTGRYGH